MTEAPEQPSYRVVERWCKSDLVFVVQDAGCDVYGGDGRILYFQTREAAQAFADEFE